MQGVLLAAGKGTRLQPLTLARTKAMAPVAGRPLGVRVADLLVAQGINELIVVVSPSDEEVQPYFARARQIWDSGAFCRAGRAQGHGACVEFGGTLALWRLYPIGV